MRLLLTSCKQTQSASGGRTKRQELIKNIDIMSILNLLHFRIDTKMRGKVVFWEISSIVSTCKVNKAL